MRLSVTCGFCHELLSLKRSHKLLGEWRATHGSLIIHSKAEKDINASYPIWWRKSSLSSAESLHRAARATQSMPQLISQCATLPVGRRGISSFLIHEVTLPSFICMKQFLWLRIHHKINPFLLQDLRSPPREMRKQRVLGDTPSGPFQSETCLPLTRTWFHRSLKRLSFNIFKCNSAAVSV